MQKWPGFADLWPFQPLKKTVSWTPKNSGLHAKWPSLQFHCISTWRRKGILECCHPIGQKTVSLERLRIVKALEFVMVLFLCFLLSLFHCNAIPPWFPDNIPVLPSPREKQFSPLSCQNFLAISLAFSHECTWIEWPSVAFSANSLPAFCLPVFHLLSILIVF